jgi:hypothetical protein
MTPKSCSAWRHRDIVGLTFDGDAASLEVVSLQCPPIAPTGGFTVCAVSGSPGHDQRPAHGPRLIDRQAVRASHQDASGGWAFAREGSKRSKGNKSYITIRICK